MLLSEQSRSRIESIMTIKPHGKNSLRLFSFPVKVCQARGNSKSFNDNPYLVKKTMNKEDQYRPLGSAR
jgi:hypothetical protein